MKYETAPDNTCGRLREVKACVSLTRGSGPDVNLNSRCALEQEHVFTAVYF